MKNLRWIVWYTYALIALVVGLDNFIFQPIIPGQLIGTCNVSIAIVMMVTPIIAHPEWLRWLMRRFEKPQLKWDDPFSVEDSAIVQERAHQILAARPTISHYDGARQLLRVWHLK